MKERLRQIRQAWSMLKDADPRAVPYVVAGATAGLLLGVGLGFLIGLWAMPVFGVLFALLGALVVFNRRIQTAQYDAIEGRPGAAAAILQQMRGQWFVTPAVAVTSKQDLVHRVVGRCGVVLVGEGSPQRVKGLLAKERKRLSKVVGDVGVHTVLVGDREGQIPIRKLQLHLSKLKRQLGRKEVPKLERRLKPLDKDLPIPKGIDPVAASRRRPKPR